MEVLKTQVNELQMRKREDDLIIKEKSKEIEILRREAGIASAGKLLLEEITPFQSNRAISKRPFVRSNSIAASNPSAHCGHLGTKKSIWTPFNDSSVEFGFFDIISQVFFD